MSNLAKSTSATKSGRLAILARSRLSDDWTQVESVIGTDIAVDMVERLTHEDDYRVEMVNVMKGEEWGDNAPNEMPSRA